MVFENREYLSFKTLSQPLLSLFYSLLHNVLRFNFQFWILQNVFPHKSGRDKNHWHLPLFCLRYNCNKIPKIRLANGHLRSNHIYQTPLQLGLEVERMAAGRQHLTKLFQLEFEQKWLERYQGHILLEKWVCVTFSILSCVGNVRNFNSQHGWKVGPTMRMEERCSRACLRWS